MKKKNTTNKKLASAASMLLLSTAMLGMATYAWFTMNKEVSVTGMKLKAQATEGLVISGDNKANWKTDWDVNMSAGIALYPTSSNGAGTPEWAVAYSKEFDDAYKNQDQSGAGGYTDLTMTYNASAVTGSVFTANVDGVGQVTPSGGSAQNYVLKKTYFIKSTGESALAKNLKIKEVTADVLPGNTGSGTADLNKALRVLVVVGNNGYLYAPVSGYDNNTKFKGSTTLTLKASNTVTSTSVNSIANTDAGAIQVDMYMYYEGEDQNCKSSNITGISVDTLNVSATFTTE